MIKSVKFSVSNLIFYVSLFTLVFPAPLLIEGEGQLIFGHYLSLLVAIPVLSFLQPIRLSPVLFTLCMLLISTTINFNEASISVWIFHSLHLIAIGLLSSVKIETATRIAKFSIIVYVVTILSAQLLMTAGMSELASRLSIVVSNSDEGYRISAFATEPAFAGLILLIFTRFLIIYDPDWMSTRRFYLILMAMIFLNSLFAIISAVLLSLIHLNKFRNIRAWASGMLIFGLLSMGFLYLGEYTERVREFDFSNDLMGFGSGSIRLLPYIYLFDELPKTDLIAVLLWGAGADTFQSKFFLDVGQFYTRHNQLSGHTAAMIYNYGVLAVVPWFLWNRPQQFLDRLLYLTMATLVLLNTGIGSYLFLIFGIYSIAEQRGRNTTSSTMASKVRCT